jgi:serine/threonine protein kinase/predicted ATPase
MGEGLSSPRDQQRVAVMTPEHWQKIVDLAEAAAELANDQRAAFLEKACLGDTALQTEVESLLASDEQSRGFIEAPVFRIAAELIADDHPTSRVGEEVNAYKIVDLLGVGGMGEVYLAQDTRLGRRVALKFLPGYFTSDKSRVRRFEQEARAASALNHPNILTVYDIGEAAGTQFIATEFIDGETLRQHMDTVQMTVGQVLDIAIQVASALAAAHQAGIVHRDIKPENIMLRPDGYIKVLDFGLAKVTARRQAKVSDGAIEPTTKTDTGRVMGTPHYMSPEHARGLSVDGRSDLFSLGVVIYEMLTCRKPFEGETPSHVVVAILEENPLPVSEISPGVPTQLEDVVIRALQKDREARYQTAGELIEDLRNVWYREEEAGREHTAVLSLSPSRNLPCVPALRRHMVGRQRERAELRAGFESAIAGPGLLLCVAGEPGIGKTTLVEAFLAELTAERQCTIARGRCSERLVGTGAYLALLEALESLLHRGANPALSRLLKQIAPTWYAQVVTLSGSDEEATRLLNEVRAASQERMKRELGTFLQEVARLGPLVLFFDDLHWADLSTIDLLSFLAGRFDALNVLIVVSYRPSDLLLQKHPFLRIRPDLQARGLCRELAPGFLREAEIAQYLALEFPGHRFPAEFPQMIHLKTEGSPLFMADLVRYLRDRGVIAQANGEWTLAQALPEIERDLPESSRGMIERKIAQLAEEDRQLLLAASVQGYEFDSAVVARVLKIEVGEVEERLESLERVYDFVRLVEERQFSDRTLTLRYRFVHVLYQNALYGALRATRKVTLSRDVAQALEGFHGGQRARAASELAALWEGAREYARAAEYFHLAAQQASQVSAPQEASALARRGLRMIEMLPEIRERGEQELSLQLVLGNALSATQGYAAPEVEETFSRAHELGEQIGETQYLLQALWGLSAVNHTRGEYRKALAYREEFLRLAERLQGPTVVVGHICVATPLYCLGEFERAHRHAQQSASSYTPEEHRLLTWLYGQDPGTMAELYVSWTLWLLGYPDQALVHGLESLRLGRDVSHANSQAFALIGAATTYQYCGDLQRLRELAEEAVAFSVEQGLPFWRGLATMLRGWAMVGQGETAEGIEEMRRGIADFKSTGAEILLACDLCLLAAAYGKAGQPREGLAVLAEAQALVEKNEERCWEAELYRLKGELRCGAGWVASEVESCFHQAIHIARRQRAKSLELRAAMSLSRWWQRQGKRAEAQQILADIYGWFTEGFDTADLKEARVLLEELKQLDAKTRVSV